MRPLLSLSSFLLSFVVVYVAALPSPNANLDPRQINLQRPPYPPGGYDASNCPDNNNGWANAQLELASSKRSVSPLPANYLEERANMPVNNNGRSCMNIANFTFAPFAGGKVNTPEFYCPGGYDYWIAYSFDTGVANSVQAWSHPRDPDAGSYHQLTSWSPHDSLNVMKFSFLTGLNIHFEFDLRVVSSPPVPMSGWLTMYQIASKSLQSSSPFFFFFGLRLGLPFHLLIIPRDRFWICIAVLSWMPFQLPA